MERGSEKILQAWRGRLDDVSVDQIAKQYNESAAEVISAEVESGGGALRVISQYAVDDFEQCGNDLTFWLNFLRHHSIGGSFVIPRVIVNGVVAIDSAALVLHYGPAVAPAAVEVVAE